MKSLIACLEILADNAILEFSDRKLQEGKYGKCGDYHIDTLCNGRIKISKQNEEEK